VPGGRAGALRLADARGGADPQANASLTLLDGQGAEPPTLGNVLVDRVPVAEAIRPTRIPGLDVLPADARLADAALLLANLVGREHRFLAAVEDLGDRYDALVVDCPPQMSLVPVNVLVAVEELVVPVDAGVYSVAGLAQLQQTVEDVRRYLKNEALRVAGLLLTRTNNNKATKDIVGQLRGAFGPLVYRATVPHSVRVEEAHARNLTVLEFAPTSAPARAYADLLTEVLDDGREQLQPGDPDPAGHADPEARADRDEPDGPAADAA
jgi:chromosome partitioning protein